jgi:hypothetical protein
VSTGRDGKDGEVTTWRGLRWRGGETAMAQGWICDGAGVGVCVFLFLNLSMQIQMRPGGKVEGGDSSSGLKQGIEAGGVREAVKGKKTKRPSVETEGRLTIACHMKNLERSMLFCPKAAQR